MEGYSNPLVPVIILYAITLILAVLALISMIAASSNLTRLKSSAIKWSLIYSGASLVFGIFVLAIGLYALSKEELLIWTILLPFQLGPFYAAAIGIINSLIVPFYAWTLSKRGFLSEQGIMREGAPRKGSRKWLWIIGAIILLAPIISGLVSGLNKLKNSSGSNINQNQMDVK
jgi:hypothetical protein